ncbi:MAG: helicase-related protein, partial [Gemmatimonadales bacterium]
MARSLLPDEDPDSPPPWLLPGQVPSFRRVLAAIRRHHGAVLADPVGSGKTYVALAAAAALNPDGPTACLVPATLCGQWQAVAAGRGLTVVVVSHQQLSRGHLPEGTRGLVIVDESHHFRNPGTRRYRHIAPWLVGRATLMVTATPIVNRLDDLAHQLLLGVRDDALLGDGVASLRSLLAGGCGSPALGRLVIENPGIAVTRPERTAWTSRPDRRECTAATEALEIITPLRLSGRRSVASLVRAVLCRAASSSPAALVVALERYRLLLLQSRDANRAGRRLERAEIRRFTGDLEEQLVWWELLPAEQEEMEPELDLTDLEAIEAVLRHARRLAEAPDPKLDRLQALLADQRPTLVFVARRETVRYLRDRIGGSTIAWCTGERAGLGRSSVPRATVLEWFGDGAGAEIAERIGVRHLVVTDVAAEGLDLQRAARVIHYDLPWTPMRLEQREGRAVRLGSRHRSVEV